MSNLPVHRSLLANNQTSGLRTFALFFKDIVESQSYYLENNSGLKIEMPCELVQILSEAADTLAAGGSVKLLSSNRDLTTQQAAGLLNVSRQFFITLLKDNCLPFTLVGKHRRIRLDDLLAYKHQKAIARTAALSKLTRSTQIYSGYPELTET